MGDNSETMLEVEILVDFIRILLFLLVYLNQITVETTA